MPARSEPLLWVQLIGAGVFPLEGLLLLLVLAGSDPGPVPGLERLLCWALGALAPSVLLWRRPADVWSLLVLQTPLRARRPLQQRLSRLQDNRGLRVGLAVAGASSLPLLWWLDEHAAVASSLSPLQDSPRLVGLLLAALLLALMLWQWQQLLQSLWLLTRSADTVAAAKPMPQAELEEQRLCLGLPLLLLDPLQLDPDREASGLSAGAGLDSQLRPEPLASPLTQPGGVTTTAEATAAPSAESVAIEAEQTLQPAPQTLASPSTGASSAIDGSTEMVVSTEVVVSSEIETSVDATVAAPAAADQPLSASPVRNATADVEQDSSVSRAIEVEQSGAAAELFSEAPGGFEQSAPADATITPAPMESVSTERLDAVPEPVAGASPGLARDPLRGDREQSADASAGPSDGADAHEPEAPQD